MKCGFSSKAASSFSARACVVMRVQRYAEYTLMIRAIKLLFKIPQNLCAPTGERTLSFSFSFSFSFSLSLSLSLPLSLSRSHALSSMSLTPKRREITNRDDAEINEQRLIALRFECVCIHKQTSWKPSHRVPKRSFKSEEFFRFFERKGVS